MFIGTIIISALTILAHNVCQTSAETSWSQELVPTRAPKQNQPLIAPNHAYPSNSTPASLLTGTIAQDPIFDDLPEAWNGQESFPDDRKWFAKPDQDIHRGRERETDTRAHNVSLRLIDLLHPPATYFSFADRLASPQQRSLIPMKNHMITPRSSESNTVWTELPDLSSSGPNTHRVVSRQLVEPSNKSPYMLERRLSQRNTPQNFYNQGKNSPWLKAIASRIGRSPSSSNDAHLDDPSLSSRATKVTFDDQVGQLDVESPSTSGSSKRDLSGSIHYPSLPLFYESHAQASEARNLRAPSMVDEESLADSVAAQSRYSAFGHQHPIQPQIYAAFPAPYGLSYKNSPVSTRKGAEKSILIGIGSALISFLILSNIFLSLPLLAITFMHFISGTNLFPSFGNNNQTPNGNNNNLNNGQLPTANGRRKRDVERDLLTERVHRAIDGFTSKLKIH